MKFKLLICIFFPFISYAQYSIEVLDSNTFKRDTTILLSKTSFRGMSVVNDSTIWISGSRGTVAKSIDGGKSFSFQRIKGYEKSDFRDIEAFDTKRAIIMSSGTPALILSTADGGNSWKEIYRNNDSSYFLDAMDFLDEKTGMVIGDPINKHFVFLLTTNGGKDWKELDSTITPKAIDGESLFAASGTCFRKISKETYAFVTGGNTSGFYKIFYPEFSYSIVKPTNLCSGSASKGAYSFCYSIDTINFDEQIFIVGGDYTNDKSKDSCFSYYKYNSDGGCIVTGNFVVDQQLTTHGYRSCIEEIIPKKLYIACGTSGVDLGTEKWKTISNESFNVVMKAKYGNAVFLAGNKGKIGKLKY